MVFQAFYSHVYHKKTLYIGLLNNLTKLSEQLGLKVTKNGLKTNLCKVLYVVDLAYPKSLYGSTPIKELPFVLYTILMARPEYISQ